MPSHAEFIANICQHPADMGPRLVYADWLEEQGDVRGEYIRMAIELAEQNFPPLFDVSYDLAKILTEKLDLTTLQQNSTITNGQYDQAERYVYLRTRLAELLTPARRREWTMAGLPESAAYNVWTYSGETVTRGGIWLGHSGEESVYADFARGFPEVLTLRWEEWQRHYRTLIDAMPVRQVNLTDATGIQYGGPLLGKVTAVLRHDGRTFVAEANSIEVAGLMILKAAFPGHDPAHPIRYTLPARQAEYVMDGFVQTEIGQFRPIEPPFITDPV